MKLLVATRSPHKLREIRAILREVATVQIVDLNDVGIPYAPEEEEIEIFDTFSENAIAKAEHFRQLTNLPTIADDSGLAVDALDGAPGVRSKRFSPAGEGLEGEERDGANNDYLLSLLGDLDLAKRTARYVCVAALDRGEGEVVTVRGEAEGLILGHRRGRGGFGYDPLFFDPTSGKTFAELTSDEKDARSHRGKAFRALARHLAGQEPAGGEG